MLRVGHRRAELRLGIPGAKMRGPRKGMSVEQRKERDALIVADVQGGATYAEAGRKHGLGRQAVKKIIARDAPEVARSHGNLRRKTECRECPICSTKFEVQRGSRQVYCSPEHGYQGLRQKREEYERSRIGSYVVSASAYDRRNTGPSWRQFAVRIYGDRENRTVCAV